MSRSQEGDGILKRLDIFYFVGLSVPCGIWLKFSLLALSGIFDLCLEVLFKSRRSIIKCLRWIFMLNFQLFAGEKNRVSVGVENPIYVIRSRWMNDLYVCGCEDSSTQPVFILCLFWKNRSWLRVNCFWMSALHLTFCC